MSEDVDVETEEETIEMGVGSGCRSTIATKMKVGQEDRTRWKAVSSSQRSTHPEPG